MSDRQEYLKLLQEGSFTHIIGADEVGYGAWAGPLLVCAAIVPRDWKPPQGLNDSKKLKPAMREELFSIMRNRVPYVCRMVMPEDIDREGVIVGLRRCFLGALEEAKEKYPSSLIVVDGLVKIPFQPYLHFPRADGEVPAVMAASVIAKVIRDLYMQKLAEKYPGYGFGDHMGYGTPQHKAAIDKKGLCPMHRRSYVPISEPEEDPGISVE